MPLQLYHYLLFVLFLIASGGSLFLVAQNDENRPHWFRTKVMVLYGLSGILVLLLFVPSH